MDRRAILLDVTKCIGCDRCVKACQLENQQPAHKAERFDEQSFTFVSTPVEFTFARRMCMHCADPTCVSVCPVGALRKTKEGPVTYDADRCMGCRYCVAACPFGVPAYEWHSATPRMRKCQMCAGRTGGPACAEACMQEATMTGPREAMIGLARKRLAEDPESYFPHIYGLTEAGGTDVLYIGPISPTELGLPALGEHPLPALTWSALKHVPDVAVFGSVLLGGLHWFTKRKEQVALNEGDGADATRHATKGTEDRDGKR